MENDLIRRKDLAEGIACHKQYTDQKYETDRQWAIGYNAGIERALFSIRYARGIEAEPVRHGRWVSVSLIDHKGRVLMEQYKCSECGRLEDNKQPYCHCGAKMGTKDDA